MRRRPRMGDIMASSVAIELAVRYLLVVLFFPFSALDKILNFRGAVGQAREIAPNQSIATLLILAGLCVEIVMPLGILTGVADRAAALVMAGYCMVTALLWSSSTRPRSAAMPTRRYRAGRCRA